MYIGDPAHTQPLPASICICTKQSTLLSFVPCTARNNALYLGSTAPSGCHSAEPNRQNRRAHQHSQGSEADQGADWQTKPPQIPSSPQWGEGTATHTSRLPLKTTVLFIPVVTWCKPCWKCHARRRSQLTALLLPTSLIPRRHQTSQPTDVWPST